MLVRSHAFAIQRGIAEHVLVELDVRAGLPAFSVIGLAPGAARDARERVHAAVINSGLPFPRRRVTINLAPASTRRNGPEFDLAIAVCVVAADGALDAEPLARVGLFGELGLGGLLRPCSSPAAAATAAGEADLSALIVSWADAEEARAARALPVFGVRDLAGVVALLATRQIAAHGRGHATERGARTGGARRGSGGWSGDAAAGRARANPTGGAAPPPLVSGSGAVSAGRPEPAEGSAGIAPERPRGAGPAPPGRPGRGSDRAPAASPDRSRTAPRGRPP